MYTCNCPHCGKLLYLYQARYIAYRYWCDKVCYTKYDLFVNFKRPLPPKET